MENLKNGETDIKLRKLSKFKEELKKKPGRNRKSNKWGKT